MKFDLGHGRYREIEDRANAIILDFDSILPPYNLEKIAEKLGISRDGVKYHIDRLKQSVGLIHDGPTKKGRWIVTNP